MECSLDVHITFVKHLNWSLGPDLLNRANLRNIPSAAQMTVVAYKQSRCSSGAGDLLTTQVQNSLRHAFFGH